MVYSKDEASNLNNDIENTEVFQVQGKIIKKQLLNLLQVC